MLDRRRLALDALRMRGGLTVNELASELRVTRTAAKNHVDRLLAEGLVAASGLRASGRRPGVVYSLTAEADRAFHQEYDSFANDVLDEIARRGDGQVDRVLRGVGDRWIANDAPSVRSLSGEPRLARVTKLIAARGFMPTLEKTSSRCHLLQNHNCPIAQICRAHHQAAGMVKRWIEALVGRRVAQTNCIYKGGHVCAYELDAKLGKKSRATSDTRRDRVAGSR